MSTDDTVTQDHGAHERSREDPKGEDWTKIEGLARALAEIGEATVGRVADLVSEVIAALGIAQVQGDLWPDLDRPLTAAARDRVRVAGDAIVAMARDAWFLPPEATEQKQDVFFQVCAQLDVVVEAVREIG